MKETRKTIDIGLALSPLSMPDPYKPYSEAGFSLFLQKYSGGSGAKAVLMEAFKRGYESVILVAHGAPNLPPRYLEDAVNALRNGKEIILGPALNGKLYLIGMKRSGFMRLNTISTGKRILSSSK
jgi:glycosyltransferase A (GT-A) superfamily protein (DUF2064 family)